jgi:hypothetical protein
MIGLLLTLSFCTLIPGIVAILINPILGMILSILGFYVWKTFGPPPSQGYINGILSLCGYATILGVLLGTLLGLLLSAAR